MSTTSGGPDSVTLREAAPWVVLYIVVGLLRPSWISRHLRLSFAQHFRRIFLRRTFVLVALRNLRPFNERAATIKEDLRGELDHEPTADEMVARFDRP